MRFLTLLLVACFLTACSGLESDSNHTWENCDYSKSSQNITGQNDLGGDARDFLIVNLEAGESPEEVSRSLGIDLRPTSKMTRWTGFYEAAVPEGSVPQIKAHLGHLDINREIESVEEDHAVRSSSLISKKPNDPLYIYQWNMDMINIPESLQTATGRGVTVAVLDTGVQYEEKPERNLPSIQDLQDTEIVPGYNTKDDMEEVWDGNGHGTHVAGTILQDTDNEYGVVGIAPNAALMPVKVLGDSGRGSASSVADGIVFAAKNGADVINMSLGSARYSEIGQEAVDIAHEESVTVVAAAGNGGSRMPSYPAAYDHVIAVSSVQMDRQPAPYTQYGPFVDLAAPGGNTNMEGGGILQETVNPRNTTEAKFLAFQGTSMASPHVAGVAALLYEWGITNPDRVEQILENSAEDPEEEELNGRNLAEKYGAGILNASESVKNGIFKVRYRAMFLAFLLSLIFFYLVRGKDSILSASAQKIGFFLGSSLLFASGLWFLPFVVPTFGSGIAASIVKFLSTSVTQWDFLAVGIHTPVLSSALLPIISVALFHGHKTLKYVSAGLGVAVAASLLVAGFMPFYTLAWIPGVWASVWMVVNALVSLAITYLSLKGEFDNVLTSKQDRSE